MQSYASNMIPIVIDIYLSYSGLKSQCDEKRIRWVYTETKSCKLVLVRYKLVIY